MKTKQKKENFQIFSVKENKMLPCEGYDLGTVHCFEWFVHKTGGYFKVSEKISGMSCGSCVRIFDAGGTPGAYCAKNVAAAMIAARNEINYMFLRFGHDKFCDAIRKGQERAKASA